MLNLPANETGKTNIFITRGTVRKARKTIPCPTQYSVNTQIIKNMNNITISILSGEIYRYYIV
jgi:hypothetical protein